MLIKIAVQNRDLGNKSVRKNLRKTGLTPAIIYSKGQPGTNISVPTNEFSKLYKKSINQDATFVLDLNGIEHKTIVKARQIHPVTREFVHIDFLEIHDN